MIPAESAPGFTNALATFQAAALHVPAYRDFLKKNGTDPQKVSSPADFATVPPMTKENYLRQYPLKDLMWDGTFEQARTVSMSSGSSGKPFYWPRGEQARATAAQLHDTLFRQSFGTLEKQTLCIVAFSMGTWIAGTYTFTALNDLADRGHRISVISPGINKSEIARILRDLSPSFEQTVICGYPPFVKDALDEAEAIGIDLAPLSLKLLFAGENFSEKWREYVINKARQFDAQMATAAIYGTADAGMLGHETPFSIFIRQIASSSQEFQQKVFGSASAVPTLVTYQPELRYFEQLDTETLAFTANNTLPLIRYDILDRARLFSGHELARHAYESGSIPGDRHQPYLAMPYIGLFGRDDVAATFYALNIYPENIRAGLEDGLLSQSITGKFVTDVRHDPVNQQQSLHILVELKPGIFPDESLKEVVRKNVIASLCSLNSEYNKLRKEMGPAVNPVIHLEPNDSEHFSYQVKHRWVVKS